ncbi:16158_t:CDS:2 [Dentiscutata heterogama]|uniref:16158_t:CDS:1 n=1 Tax=Dentiscutata heterogama TaxID=1316150 RepID=A0ACA9K133_9GLOM|nr:16158_t:CDS:2 [Dentiscutata heterogama]
MVFIKTIIEGKILVKALINTTSKFNTISKCLYNKLEENYGLEGISGDDLIGKEIKCLDLQFWYKGKWRSLDGTEVIDFQIRKNSSFNLVLGWDCISILLIEENSNKASSSKNNLSHSETEIDKPDLNLEKFIDIFKKLSIETNLSSSDSESMEDNSSNDGVLKCHVFSKSVLYFLVKIKNEIGTGSSDLTVQAGASFAKYYTQQTYGKLQKGEFKYLFESPTELVTSVDDDLATISQEIPSNSQNIASTIPYKQKKEQGLIQEISAGDSQDDIFPSTQVHNSISLKYVTEILLTSGQPALQ